MLPVFCLCVLFLPSSFPSEATTTLECATCPQDKRSACLRTKCEGKTCFNKLVQIWDMQDYDSDERSSGTQKSVSKGCLTNDLFHEPLAHPNYRHCEYGMKIQQCVYHSVCSDSSLCNLESNIRRDRDGYAPINPIKCVCEGELCNNGTCTGNTCFLLRNGLGTIRGCAVSPTEALITVTQLQSRPLAEGKVDKEAVAKSKFGSYICETPLCNSEIPFGFERTLGSCPISVSAKYRVGDTEEPTVLGQCLGHFCTNFTRKVYNGNGQVDVHRSYSACAIFGNDLRSRLVLSDNRTVSPQDCYEEGYHDYSHRVCLRETLSQDIALRQRLGVGEVSFDSVSILICVLAVLILVIFFLCIHLYIMRAKDRKAKKKAQETLPKTPERTQLLQPDEVRNPSFSGSQI